MAYVNRILGFFPGFSWFLKKPGTGNKLTFSARSKQASNDFPYKNPRHLEKGEGFLLLDNIHNKELT